MATNLPRIPGDNGVVELGQQPPIPYGPPDDRMPFVKHDERGLPPWMPSDPMAPMPATPPLRPYPLG